MKRIALILFLQLPVFGVFADNRIATVYLVSSNYYPHYGESLPLQGATIEIIRQAFALQGIETHITFMPFARAYRESQQAHYSGLIAAWYNDERAKHFLYSQPLYANQIVFFKRQSHQVNYRHYHDLKQQNLQVAVVQGYSQPDGLVESGVNTISVATDEQAFQMLLLKRVDLVPADKLNGQYLINKQLPASAHLFDWMTPALELRPMYLLIPKQEPRAEELMQHFNTGLALLRQSGHYQQIIDHLLPAAMHYLQTIPDDPDPDEYQSVHQ